MQDTAVQLLLMGRAELEDERGTRYDVPGGLQSVIGRLAIGGPAHREVLMEALWPDQPAPQVRRRLNTLLWRLRRFIGDRHLHCADSGLVSFADTVGCDAVVFEREQALDAGLRGALDRYGGELLPGCYDDWVVRERERLRALQLGVLRRLAHSHEERGDLDLAIRYAAELSAADPLREDVHRLLMRLYARAGRRADAVRQYEACAAQLARELRIDPMPETVLLAADIRAGRPPSAGVRPAGEALADLRAALASCRSSVASLERAVSQVEGTLARDGPQ
jgi:DNA-binding SARP family transcriptional activator